MNNKTHFVGLNCGFLCKLEQHIDMTEEKYLNWYIRLNASVIRISIDL